MRHTVLYTGRLSGLYGAASFSRRYGQSGTRTDWEAEMSALARVAGYTGQAQGYDLGKTGIKAPEAIYAEFRVVGSDCTLWYKRMPKMDADSGGPNAPDEHIRELAPDPTARKALFDAGLGHTWDNNNPVRKISTNLGRGGTSDVHLKKVTRGNKGELHEVKTLIEFTV